MLILTRRRNEALCIGADITVKVLGIHGGQIRLGITAPRNVVVDREEIHQRKLAEYRRATDPHLPAEGESASCS